MKMRLKPLRGQTYCINKNIEAVEFLEKINEQCKVYSLTKKVTMVIPMDELGLPIIDTKDYEKIDDTKHKGD